MDLAELLEQLRHGEELAWEAFVRQFQSRVFGLSYHYLGNRDEALDLSQEVFIRVYQHLEQLPLADGLLPWLIRITRNACIDHLRRRKARPPLWDLPAETLFTLAASGADPEQEHLRARRRADLHRALRDLSELNREIIVLKEIQGLALDQIAHLLELPLGTVKSRSHRARLELAERLQAQASDLVPVPG